MISRNMFCKEDLFNRFVMMLNDEQKEKLFSKSIIIFGVGGVGGAVAHMLSRSGIQNLTLVDFDKIDITNINRQFVANTQNIGNLKVEELKKQLELINPEIKINTYSIKYSEETASQIDLTKFDYIVDCIDDIKAKKLLILKAKEHKIPIICAMGAGNRFEGVPNFEIADIKKTSYDPIAKILRKFCAEQGINKLTVCYTKQKATKFDCKIIGSVVYYVVNMATVICSKVVNDILSWGDYGNN